MSLLSDVSIGEKSDAPRWPPVPETYARARAAAQAAAAQLEGRAAVLVASCLRFVSLVYADGRALLRPRFCHSHGPCPVCLSRDAYVWARHDWTVACRLAVPGFTARLSLHDVSGPRFVKRLRQRRTVARHLLGARFLVQPQEVLAYFLVRHAAAEAFTGLVQATLAPAACRGDLQTFYADRATAPPWRPHERHGIPVGRLRGPLPRAPRLVHEPRARGGLPPQGPQPPAGHHVVPFDTDHPATSYPYVYDLHRRLGTGLPGALEEFLACAHAHCPAR